MPDIIPTNTEVLVCSGVPLDNKYNDTILFTSAGAQQGYFRGKAKYTYNGNFTYQRVQNKVNNFSSLQTLPNPRIEFSTRIPVNADKVYDCNYLCFCNHYDTNKWWYCFIKEINYINPNCCEIIYEIDAMQTFLFDFTVQKSFVEREHTATDNLFEHVCLEDDIAIGDEEIINFEPMGSGNLIFNKNNIKHYVLCTKDVSSELGGGTLITPTPNKLVGLDTWQYSSSIALRQALENVTKPEGVVCIFSSPFPAGSFQITNWTPNNTTFNISTLNGVQIHNKMMLQAPFRKVLIYSTDGDLYELNPKLFNNNEAYFEVGHGFTGDTMYLYAKPHYQNEASNKLYLITCKGWAMGSFETDTYKAWYAQNGASLSMQRITGAINATVGALATGLNIASKNALGATYGVQNAAQGIRDIMQADARIKDAQHLSNQPHGKFNDSNISFENSETGLYFIDKTFDAKSLKRIDDYFTRYGYKINTIKIPTPFDGHKRPVFNYVKTTDVNITGSVPTPQMNIIKSAFDDGITFWHNPNSVGVYGEGENDV